MFGKRILILLVLFIASSLISCDIAAATVNRIYYFGTYEEMIDIIDNLDFASGYRYIFYDLLNEDSVNDANYGFETLYLLSESNPLRLANSSPPVFYFVYEVIDQNVNVIIMKINPMSNDISTADDIGLKYEKQTVKSYGFLSQETNNLLEETEVKDFFIDYYERVQSNSPVAATTYRIFLADDLESENDLIKITFVYSPFAEDFSADYELSILDILVGSETEFTLS